jgi:hypothetical protein
MPVDLILYYYGNATDKEGIMGTVLNHGVARLSTSQMGKCFASVRVEYAGLPDLRYPEAPCRQFTRIFSQSPVAWGYDAIYQMEPDVAPLRENWLQSLMPLFQKAASGKAWVIGGGADARCLTDDKGRGVNSTVVQSKDKALNGNAVYTTKPDFVGMVRKYESFCGARSIDLHVGSNSQTQPEPGGDYDINLYWQHHSGSFLQQWSPDETMRNCKYPPFHSRSLKDIAAMFPNTFLAHVDGAALAARKEI